MREGHMVVARVLDHANRTGDVVLHARVRRVESAAGAVQSIGSETAKERLAGHCWGLSRRGEAVHQENDHDNCEHHEEPYPQLAATAAHATATAARFTLGGVSVFAACTRLTRGAVGVIARRT